MRKASIARNIMPMYSPSAIRPTTTGFHQRYTGYVRASRWYGRGSAGGSSAGWYTGYMLPGCGAPPGGTGNWG